MSEPRIQGPPGGTPAKGLQ
ncbi:hypothetical protein KIPB_013739, partial [Kipferlia bialata]|eukprot:g13739.t1